MGLGEWLVVRRATRVARRGDRERVQRLRRELATYTSEADQRELDAILARYPESQTAELDGIVADQRRRAQRRTGTDRPA